MSEENWVANIIQKVQEQNRQAPESWFTLMKILLEGQLSERILTRGDLSALADTLIQAVSKDEQKEQASQ